MNVYICMYIYVIFRYMQKDFIMQGLAQLKEIETTMLRQFIAFWRFISYNRECNFQILQRMKVCKKPHAHHILSSIMLL